MRATSHQGPRQRCANSERTTQVSISTGQTPATRRWHRWRIAGSATGLLLFAVAIWLIATHRQEAASAWESLQRPDPLAILIVLGTILASIPLSAVVQQILLHRSSGVHVPLGEMSRLVSAAGLLNMLPLWPGALGRIGYHRVVHGIEPMRSGVAIVGSRLLAAGGGLIILCAAWVVGPRGVDWAIAVWVAMLAGLTLPGLWPSLRAASWAAVAVWVDLGLSAIRYVAAFYLLGTSLDAVTSEALAGTSNLASSVPFVGGGPGLREWAVGWMTSRLELLPDALVLGVMADILVRIGTLIVLAPLGGWSLKSLSGTLKRAVMDQSSSGSMPKSRTVNNASNS